MPNVLIESETMGSIGDAIREKTGKGNKIYPRDMPSAIKGIGSGDFLTEEEADGRYLLREGYNDVSGAFGITIKPNPDDPNEDVIFDFFGFSSGGIGAEGAPVNASLTFGEFLMSAGAGVNSKSIRLFYKGESSYCLSMTKGTSLQLENVELLGLPTPSDDSSPTPKSYVDGLVGDINAVLDQINGEVV